jgi:hypothetical protein
MIGKMVSLVVAIGYLGGLYWAEGTEHLARVAVFLVFPLSFIWFSEEIGSYSGYLRGHHVDAPSPGCLVAFFGWLFLLAPAVLLVVGWLWGWK